ncbi:MAG: PilZ domain-containing protein [Candidatus Acidiferrales bacterium]
MAASEADRLRVARELLLSLITGSSITLVLAMMRAGGAVPEIADLLLRPGAYAASKLGVGGAGGILLSVLGDGIFYGSLPFLIMHLRSAQRRPKVSSSLKFEPLTERRRAARLPAKTPVFVYGRYNDGNGNEPFSEISETLNVSALGGLIPLAAKVSVSQRLILFNAESNAELPCRVARTIRTVTGETMIGVEFAQSSAQFWKAPEPDAIASLAPSAIHSNI